MVERTAGGPEGFLREILGVSEEGLVIVAPDETVVFVNDVARTLLGLPAEGGRLPGPAATVLAADGAEPAGEDLPWRRALATGAPVRDVRMLLRTASGTEPLHVSAVPLAAESGDVLGAAVAFAPRGAAPHPPPLLGAPVSSEALLDQLPVGVIVLDDAGRLCYSNGKHGDLLGIAAGGQSMREQVRVFEAFRPDGTVYPPEERAIVRALEGETVRDDEMTIVRPDGTRHVVLASAGPLLDADGRRVGVLGALADVTAWAAAERLSAAMGEIATSMDTGADEREMTGRVLVVAARALSADGAALLRHGVEKWLIVRAHGQMETAEGTAVADADMPPAVDRLTRGETVATTDAFKTFGPGWVERRGVKAAIATPVAFPGEAPGILVLTFARTTTFEPAQTAAAARLANAVSLALRNAGLVQSLKLELERTKLLQDVAVAATTAGDVRRVCSRVLRAVGHHADLLFAQVAMLPEDGSTLEPVASLESEDTALRKASAEAGEHAWRLARLALERGKVLTHVDGVVELAKGSRVIALPIDFRRHALGTLALALQGSRPFTEDEIELLHAVAHTLGQAMETARLLAKEKETVRRAEDELELSTLQLETAERLARPLELDEVLDALADSLLRITGRTRVFVLMLDARTEMFTIRAVRGDGGFRVGDVGPMSRLTEGSRRMLMSGARQVTLAEIPASEQQRGRMREQGVARVLVVPIVHHNRILGAAVVDEPGRDVPFGDREMRLGENVARLAAVVTENACSYESEHRIADTLQETLLLMPDHVPGVEFGTLYRSATAQARVGGDFYDVFESAEGIVTAVVGDVSGKGLDAASVTALARNSVRIFASEGRPPSEVMTRTNAVLHRFTSTETFVTAFFAQLDVASGALRYVCGGHPDGMIVGRGGYVRLLAGQSPLLGALDQAEFAEQVTMLAPTDTLFLYTDGVTEARRGKEMYGPQRLRDFLASLRDNEPRKIPPLVLADVEAFAEGQLRDDIAMLAVRRASG